MAPAVGELRAIFRRFKPHILMVLTQLIFTFLYLFLEAALKNGIDLHVFVTYRHALGGLVIFPFAYFLERKVRPKLTLALFLEMFVLSLFGISFTLNMYFASYKYTSATFVTSVANTIPSLTFVIAVVLRLEALDVRHPRGIAKVLGTLMCLGGVTVTSLYKGPEIQSWKDAPIHITRSSSIHENWIKGPILAVASCISWSVWFTMQGITLKKYPAALSLTAWVNLIGGAQSAVFTLLIQHKPAAWSIALNVNFWTIAYAGILCCGLLIFVQLWCVEQKGPVFVTSFCPLGTVFVALQAYFLLGERLHIGRVVGATVVILGLYLVLWGKEGDQYGIKSGQKPSLTDDEPTELRIQREHSETEVP